MNKARIVEQATMDNISKGAEATRKQFGPTEMPVYLSRGCESFFKKQWKKFPALSGLSENL